MSKVNWDYWSKCLGSCSDALLADELGLTTEEVTAERKARGILGFEEPPPSRRFYDWCKYEHLFGTVPDAVIAREIGVTPPAVHYQRRKRGIPAWRNRKKTLTQRQPKD